MKTDLQLKAEVTAELVWDPQCDAAGIGVAVNDGIVTLTGQVDSLMRKHAVERAVRRVSGVRGIAMDVAVQLGSAGERTDPEIAHAAVQALRWHSLVPEDRVKVEVESGRVRLTGEVDWAYQRMSAEHCVRPLTGVRSVTNDITIKARAKVSDIADHISAALQRHARREAAHVSVEVDGSVVTLSGRVDSLPEHDAVVGTAFAAKGVSRVIDRLEVTG